MTSSESKSIPPHTKTPQHPKNASATLEDELLPLLIVLNIAAVIFAIAYFY